MIVQNMEIYNYIGRKPAMHYSVTYSREASWSMATIGQRQEIFLFHFFLY